MESSSYFNNGLQHAVFGALFVLGFHLMGKKQYARRLDYLAAAVVSSSAIFFLPGHIGRYGSCLDRLYQFLHYPLADWDILLFGISWHRFFVTHSLALPALLLILLLRHPVGHSVGMGLSVGMSSHLIWDALTCSMRTPVVFIDNVIEIRGYDAKGWLMLHGVLLLALAWHVSRVAARGKDDQ